MTKFPSREDPGYKNILGELQRWTKPIRRVKQKNAQSGQTFIYVLHQEIYKFDFWIARELFINSGTFTIRLTC